MKIGIYKYAKNVVIYYSGEKFYYHHIMSNEKCDKIWRPTYHQSVYSWDCESVEPITLLHYLVLTGKAFEEPGA